MAEITVARAKKRARKVLIRALAEADKMKGDPGQRSAFIVNRMIEEGLVVGEFEPCEICGAWIAYLEGHADWHRRSHEFRLGSGPNVEGTRTDGTDS